MTDIEIARNAVLRPITEIAEKLGITADTLIHYGKFKAKIPLDCLQPDRERNSHLILVTAVSPTPAGEGKTTVSVGLADGLSHIGKRSAVALREPSLGPVFGMKGGAAGGGRTQVVPMEDINLHFTGDFSAVEKANNLLSALIDNNIQSGRRSLGLDPRTVVWKRVMDMNDRALRQVITGLGGKNGGWMRETGFNITAASEVMAILCLASSWEDMSERFDRIYVGDGAGRQAFFAKDLRASSAMTILMKDALLPNLVQTIEGTPAFVHGGPFANIAQGTNSLLATRMAMGHADYVVTEAGFGADLGAEKFVNIKSRMGGLRPRVAVVVATVKALKYHGKGSFEPNPDPEAVRAGMCNLEKHIENLQGFGLDVVVAINSFHSDTQEEHDVIRKGCAHWGVEAVRSDGWAQGGAGCADLAQAVVRAVDRSPNPSPLQFTYPLEASLEEKIHRVATQIYGAKSVNYTAEAQRQMDRYETLGWGKLPICMAKTQKSFSDDERRWGRPDGFEVTVREFEIAAGAGFVVPILGNMLRMPGLPDVPAAEAMSVDASGQIHGLS